MKCSYCNTENATGATFCHRCGLPLKEVRQAEAPRESKPLPLGEIKCPHCGNMHPSNLRSCPKTGRDLPTTGEASKPRSARLVLQDGSTIKIDTETKALGRYDFDRFVAADHLQYISKQHFTISRQGEEYAIEDSSSKNGTLLNGKEIKDKGKQPLKSEDRIEPGKAVTVVFKLV